MCPARAGPHLSIYPQLVSPRYVKRKHISLKKLLWTRSSPRKRTIAGERCDFLNALKKNPFSVLDSHVRRETTFGRDNGASIKLVKRAKTIGESTLIATKIAIDPFTFLRSLRSLRTFYRVEKEKDAESACAHSRARSTSATILAIMLGLVLPLSVLSFLTLTRETLRYIYFLRLTPPDTRNDRYDNPHFAGRKNRILRQRIILRDFMKRYFSS